MSGTAERKTIQQPARRRRWFLTPSARKGTRINSACAYGARRECNQVLATKDPTRECVPGVGLASPLAVRAQQSRIHPQKRAEDHRKIGATLSGISDQTSVSFCDLLWMHCRLARRQNMRRIESHHSDTTTQRRLFAVLAPRESKTKITLTTDFTDHTDDKRPDSTISAFRVIRGSEQATGYRPQATGKIRLRTQTPCVGRTSDDHRTQNAASCHCPKLCLLFEFGSNIKTFGRFGRKIPEHLVVASGQWLVVSG